MNVDPTGHSFWSVMLGLLFSGVVVKAMASVVGYLGSLVASLWDSTVREDLKNINYNPFNKEEGLVLQSQKVSFYKGSFVLRHSIGNATSCGVFGMIFLNRKETNGEDVKHEFGHNMQELIIGTPAYLMFVALPSVIYCYTGEYLQYLERGDNYADMLYYSKVWERTAEMLGGVKRDFDYFYLWQWENFKFW